MPTNWSKLVSENRVVALPPTKSELDNLRTIVDRSLADIVAPGLSADARFMMAYDASRTLALIVVRASGYRPKSVGGHYNTFLGLEAADPTFAALSAYLDGCRMKRNRCEYDYAGAISDTDADGILHAAQQFSIDAEAWINAHFPHLSR